MLKPYLHEMGWAARSASERGKKCYRTETWGWYEIVEIVAYIVVVGAEHSVGLDFDHIVR